MDMILINKLHTMLNCNDQEIINLACVIISEKKSDQTYRITKFMDNNAMRSYCRGVLAQEAWQLGNEKGKEILNGTKRENATHADEQGS